MIVKLVLLRHGQSVWNMENKFTGWTDVPLSNKGIEEAKKAGSILKRNNFVFDIAFTSVLVRASDTLRYVLDELDINIPVKKSWRLNERHYGALQGLNKEKTAEKYGKDQVLVWRRSLDVKPPLVGEDDYRFPGNDLKYKGVSRDDLPFSESLEDTLKRVLVYYNSDIKCELMAGKNVIIVAHGNSLRALIKFFENLSSEEIFNFELPTGVPYVYELDADLNVVDNYFLK